ncbi:hypothetical protein [Myxococcus eversor]|uniref:hypothetical protein n=1 Tax=Myxococcus eversor TaxID=2709661 RepID=UPI0013D534E4|nr:hypothetical protein [Myxococcus eversor]
MLNELKDWVRRMQYVYWREELERRKDLRLATADGSPAWIAADKLVDEAEMRVTRLMRELNL